MMQAGRERGPITDCEYAHFHNGDVLAERQADLEGIGFLSKKGYLINKPT